MICMYVPVPATTVMWCPNQLLRPVRLLANHWWYQLLSQSWTAQDGCLWILVQRLLAATTVMNCCWNDCCQRSVTSLIYMCVPAGHRTCASYWWQLSCSGSWNATVYWSELWTQNSLNSNPVDYKVWDVMQKTVYRTLMIQDVDELKQRYIVVWSGLQQSVTDVATDQWWKRLQACVKANELNFEHLL